MLNVKRSRIVAGLGIIGAISIIIVVLILNFRPYLQISQVLEDPSRYHNPEIQVMGIVEGFSGGNFNLTQGDNTIFIDVSDITVPDDVVDGIQIVVMGRFNNLLYLNATQILVQCSWLCYSDNSSSETNIKIENIRIAWAIRNKISIITIEIISPSSNLIFNDIIGEVIGSIIGNSNKGKTKDLFFEYIDKADTKVPQIDKSRVGNIIPIIIYNRNSFKFKFWVDGIEIKKLKRIKINSIKLNKMKQKTILLIRRMLFETGEDVSP